MTDVEDRNPQEEMARIRLARLRRRLTLTAEEEEHERADAHLSAGALVGIAEDDSVEAGERAHLAACAYCREELALLESAMRVASNPSPEAAKARAEQVVAFEQAWQNIGLALAASSKISWRYGSAGELEAVARRQEDGTLSLVVVTRLTALAGADMEFRIRVNRAERQKIPVTFVGSPLDRMLEGRLAVAIESRSGRAGEDVQGAIGLGFSAVERLIGEDVAAARAVLALLALLPPSEVLHWRGIITRAAELSPHADVRSACREFSGL